MEAVDCDKKDRPKSSIKIEDCMVFVDPYKEVDEQVSDQILNINNYSIKKQKITIIQIKIERSAGEKKSKTEVEEVKVKTTFENLTAQRSGVGKYLSATLLYVLNFQIII